MKYNIRGLYLIILFLTGGLFTSCDKNESCIPSPDISDIQVDLSVERIDEKMFSAKTKAELERIIWDNPVFREYFLLASRYPHDSLLTDRLFNLLRDPHIDTLWKETRDIFGDFSGIEDQYLAAFKRIKYYYPDFRPPHIKAVFTGLVHDMYVSDSLILIGLDYYLGDEASYRPLNTPQYILKRYRKENIVPNSMLLLSNQFIKSDPADNNLLADMIYYGKAHYFAKQMLPCVPDSIFLGYTPREMRDIKDSEAVIWANFIENELLYETNHFLKDKFISERPKTFEIGQNCPGRIGRWVGWEIIKTYMERNDEVPLPELMENPNAQQIFERSRYKPES